MLKRAFDVGVRSPVVRRFLIKRLYQIIAGLDRDAALLFMNYGYAADGTGQGGVTLQPEDEVHRYPIQLYHAVAGAIDLTGKDVLEVGSGRGGGASYVTRYLKPKSYLGIDISPRAVAMCQRRHVVPGLSFRQGDAENLPVPDASVDAVVNVESSHGYGSFPRFLSEVRRVLRPGGHFLYTDHRGPHQLEEWSQAFAESGMTIVEEEDITAKVVHALDLEDARKQALIDRKSPRILKDALREFAATRGSKAYERFQDGRTIYRRYVLRSEVDRL